MNGQRYARREEHDRRGGSFEADAWEDTELTVNGGSWVSMNIVFTPMGRNANDVATRENATLLESRPE